MVILTGSRNWTITNEKLSFCSTVKYKDYQNVGTEFSKAQRQEATPNWNLTANTEHPTHILKILRVAKT